MSTDLNWFTEIDRTSLSSYICPCFILLVPLTYHIKPSVYGGQIARIPVNATAYTNRDAQMGFQLYASSHNTSDITAGYPLEEGKTFLQGMVDSLTGGGQPAAACASPFFLFIFLFLCCGTKVISLTQPIFLCSVRPQLHRPDSHPSRGS